MTKKYGKRLFCALLSTVLVLTTSGCGEKEIVVEDYYKEFKNIKKKSSSFKSKI